MKTVCFISPTERPPISSLGASSTLPEKYGADILLLGKYGMFGIQRKEVKDLVASLRGDRVSRELAQMKQLNHGCWIIEGTWGWTRDGDSLTVRGFTKSQYEGVLFSLQWNGYWVLVSESPAHTCELVAHLTRWLEKEGHQSLMRRPNPQNSWGSNTSKDWGCHLLQSFEGISYELATRIWDYFGGLPLAWTVPKWKLREVDGIGPKKADVLWKGLGGEDEE